MNRYKSKEEVNLGDRIMFDNKTGFIKDQLRVKLVGTVISLDCDGHNIKISIKVNGVKELVEREVPYFLCQ